MWQSNDINSTKISWSTLKNCRSIKFIGKIIDDELEKCQGILEIIDTYGNKIELVYADVMEIPFVLRILESNITCENFQKKVRQTYGQWEDYYDDDENRNFLKSLGNKTLGEPWTIPDGQ